MKILAIGDFHGKFPKHLKNLAKKADLILSTGDYLPGRSAKEEQNILLWIIPEETIKKEREHNLKKAEKILSTLDKLNKPVITTIGNYDAPDFEDTFERGYTRKQTREFFNLLKKFKNIKRADYKAVKFKDLVVIGAFGHSFPGEPWTKNYKKYKQKLEKLFKKYSKQKIIFLSHNSPYNTKLDIIKNKNSPKELIGKHYGSKLVKSIINKYQPFLSIAGHFHENQGKIKIKKTTFINPGPAFEGKAALIEISSQKIKKIRFINP